ncbi:MAG: glutamate--cysteine ligase [Gammaproteobacteria bacterium]
MGQEIGATRFSSQDFTRFADRLREETALLRTWLESERFRDRSLVGGFEIEAWLVDGRLRPAPRNPEFLEALNTPLATPELAKFNVEFNNQPRVLAGHALSDFHADLAALWQRAEACAGGLDLHLMLIGILPTLRESDLDKRHMSPMNRYRALNAQVLKHREGRPLRLEITGHEHLLCVHRDVMMESATTSFQIHLQVPAQQAHRYYNASIMASAPLVAVSANSPLLFGKDLWDETRIPVFEQSVELGGFDGAARGPVRRVGFGTGYVQHSIIECFQENLDHFPVLLPIKIDEPADNLAHLRLHNGTIWRWNRPLVGFGAEGEPHIRIEQRVVPAGPTLTDSIANAAFFYGLCAALVDETETDQPDIDFAHAKDNFYGAARYSLDAQLTWLDGQRHTAAGLIAQTLLPLARRGLARLGLNDEDAGRWLDIIAERVETRQHGAAWQRRHLLTHGNDIVQMSAAYLDNQRSDVPVHRWPL